MFMILGTFVWLSFMVGLIALVCIFLFNPEIFLEFELGSVWLLNMNLTFIVDKTSVVFLFMVGTVSSMVYFYSINYMKTDIFKFKFLVMMSIFVCSMLLLSLSSNLFWCMLGWDGLGVVSFALIFFYSNWKSFNSAMVTFISNRVGDVCMIVTIVWMMMNFSDKWIHPMLSNMVGLFFLIGTFSKSAQIPFSAWLPLAMAAPTPVSSLVHSSTLVTAGIYILIRFKFLLSESALLMMFYLSVMSIMLAGVSSMGDFDMKKIIALSTLSHISLIIMMISMKSYNSAIIHMVMHAFFKSILFMVVGYMIHENWDHQDVRMMVSSDDKMNLSLIISISSMCGLPFLSGFYSKELMSCNLDLFYYWCGFFMAVLFTSMYSIRLMINLLSCGNTSPIVIPCKSNFLLIYCVLISIISLIVNSFFSSDFLENFYSVKSNMVAFFFIFMGWILSYWLIIIYFFFLNSKILFTLSYMWMSLSIMIILIPKLMNWSKILMYFLDMKGLAEKQLFFLSFLRSIEKKEIMIPIKSFGSLVKYMSITSMIMMIFSLC